MVLIDLISYKIIYIHKPKPKGILTGSTPGYLLKKVSSFQKRETVLVLLLSSSKITNTTSTLLKVIRRRVGEPQVTVRRTKSEVVARYGYLQKQERMEMCKDFSLKVESIESQRIRKQSMKSTLKEVEGNKKSKYLRKYSFQVFLEEVLPLDYYYQYYLSNNYY